MRVINSLFIVYRLYEDCSVCGFNFNLNTGKHSQNSYIKTYTYTSGWGHIHTHIHTKKKPFYGYVHKTGMKKFSQNTIIYHPRTIHFMFCWVYFFSSCSIYVFVFTLHRSYSMFLFISLFFCRHSKWASKRTNEHSTPSQFIFLRRLLLPFQDFHLLLFRKVYVYVCMYIQC